MKLLLDPGHSHRWHRNMRRWLDLYEGDGAPLDDVAFTCNLAPGLGAIKVALLHYVAERHLYLAQMDMLSAAMEVTPAEWAGEVDSLALRGMTDFLGDVRTLLTPDLVELVGDVDLSPEASLGDLFADAWPVGLHDLERETLARPRDRALLGRWLHITLQAKLGEAMQTFRRSALGYWLARRHRSAAPLREVVAANVEPFGWRLSQIMHRQFVPEKVDPRSHRRLRWSGTRMDSEVRELSPILPNGTDDIRVRLRGIRQVLADGLIRGRPISGSRRMITCPRRDVDLLTARYAAETWGYCPDESVYRILCGFCYMHALTETVRNVPGFLWVNRVEAMPYHGRSSQCMFRWELALRPDALLGRQDRARLHYVQQMIKDPPSPIVLSDLDMDALQTNIRHRVWDRSCFDAGWAAGAPAAIDGEAALEVGS